jgi:integrase
MGESGEAGDREGAILARIERLLALAEARPVPVTRWAEDVRAAYAAKRPTTQGRMRQALEMATSLAGTGADTAAIDGGLVARFAAARPDHRVSTTNGLLASLRAATRLGIARRWIDPAGLAGATWRIAERERMPTRHHGRDEVARVLDGLRADARDWPRWRLYALASLLAYTGLRKMEALRLRWDQVDLERRVAWIEPNGRPLKTTASAAPVPIAAELAELLAEWRLRCASEWVIPTRSRRRPWTGGTYGRRPTDALRAAGERAGVMGFTPQSLRHSLATHLAGWWGLGPKQVQQVLRHSTVKTQDRYVHADLANLVEAVGSFTYRGGVGGNNGTGPSPSRGGSRGRAVPCPDACVGCPRWAGALPM